MAYADYTKPFILHTDASADGLGAVLYQEQDGVKRVVAFASRGLTSSEKNYPTHKLEFLALKWSVTEKFHDYLYGSTFRVYTDNNPLTYVMSSAKLDATGQRWVSQLANYNFRIHYRSGKANVDADALSRLQIPAEHPIQVMAQHVVQAALDSVQQEIPWISVMGCPGDVLPDDDGTSLLQISKKEIADAQKYEPVIAEVIDIIIGTRAEDAVTSTQARSLMRKRKQFVLQDGVLMKRKSVEGLDSFQIILPKELQAVALEGCHDQLGHLGRDKTLSILQERFFWIGMSTDVARYVAACGRCLRRKSLPLRRAPLVSITTTQPLELVCMDFLKVDPSKGGIENILVVTDHFTKFSKAYPC